LKPPEQQAVSIAEVGTDRDALGRIRAAIQGLSSTDPAAADQRNDDKSQALFDGLDANRDGVIDREEWIQLAPTCALPDAEIEASHLRLQRDLPLLTHSGHPFLQHMHATQLRDAERLLGKIEHRRQSEQATRQHQTQARWEASLSAAAALPPSNDDPHGSVLRRARALLQSEEEPLTGCVGRPSLSPNPFASVSPLSRALPSPPEASSEALPQTRDVILWHGVSADDLAEALAAPADPQSQAASPGGWKKQLIALGAHLERLSELSGHPFEAHRGAGVPLDQVAVQGALAVLRARLDEAAMVGVKVWCHDQGLPSSSAGSSWQAHQERVINETAELEGLRRELSAVEVARHNGDQERQALRHEVGQLRRGQGHLEEELSRQQALCEEHKAKLLASLEVAQELKRELTARWEATADPVEVARLETELRETEGELARSGVARKGEREAEAVRYREMVKQRDQLVEILRNGGGRKSESEEEAAMWKRRAEETVKERDEAYALLRQKDQLLESLELHHGRAQEPVEPHAQQDVDQLRIELMREKQARVIERTQYVDDLEALSDYVDDLEAQMGMGSRKREVARRSPP